MTPEEERHGEPERHSSADRPERSAGNCRVCAGSVENVEIMWKDEYVPLKLWKSNKWPLKQPVFRKTELGALKA